MRTLVLGAAGMVGREVAAAAERAGHEVLALTREELDITEMLRLEPEVLKARPEVVVNCAGYTDVDGSEDDEATAKLVNGEAAGHVAAAAAAAGAKVVYFSSDYVFDGTKDAPYIEADQPAPLSAYGRSKLTGEIATAASNPRHFVIRSAWLFGVGGKNFVETMLQLADDHGEVLVVNDQAGSPTYTRHLAVATMRLIEGEEFGIHHLAGAGRCSWYEFAQEIFDQTGRECRVMSATTEMLARKAPRPAFSALDTQRKLVLPHWRDGLAAYLKAREREGAGATGGGSVAGA